KMSPRTTATLIRVAVGADCFEISRCSFANAIALARVTTMPTTAAAATAFANRTGSGIGQFLFLPSLEADADVHLVAEGAGHFVHHAEVAPLDRDIADEPGLLHPLEINLLSSLKHELRLLRLAMHRQIALDFISVLGGFDARAFERDVGVLLGVEKVG